MFSRKSSLEAGPVILHRPGPKPTYSLGDWLRGGDDESLTRKAEFEYASYTHGAIQCRLFECSATQLRAATGAGNHEGDAFVTALRILETKEWERRSK